jgi:hypothetical protein
MTAAVVPGLTDGAFGVVFLHGKVIAFCGQALKRIILPNIFSAVNVVFEVYFVSCRVA